MTAVFDFAVLPPEVNSGRMYAGAGSGPLVAAAAAWAGLASELSAAAMSYQAEVDELTSGSWLGPSSTAMATAAAPYVTWMNTLAGQAQHSATQASAAAAAYDAAFTATVPPPIITANRTLLATLLASNIFGQNTPAIATTESHYAEMWAQDASAMYSYAGASSAAATLTPFSPAPQTTNPTQATTNTATNSVAHTLTSLASGAQATDPGTWLLNLLNSAPVQAFEALMAGTSGYQSFFLGGLGFFTSGITFLLSPGENLAVMAAMTAAAPAAVPIVAVSGAAAAAEGALAPELVLASGAANSGAATTSAAMSRAASLAGLSVPQSWGAVAPEIRLAAHATPLASLEGAARPSGLGALPMVGPIGSVVNAPRSGEAGQSTGRAGVLRAAGKSNASDSGAQRWTNFDVCTQGEGPMSERDELNRLRKALGDISTERDVLKRSATLLIKQAMQESTS